MTGHLIPNLLAKDKLETEAPDLPLKATGSRAARKSGRRSTKTPLEVESGNVDAKPSDWTLDGNVPILTRAKVRRVKNENLCNKKVNSIIGL